MSPGVISPTPTSQRKGGLGRGLAALIPTGPVGSAVSELAPRDRRPDVLPAEPAAGRPSGRVLGAVYQEVPIGSIVPNPRQPRQSFDEESLAELEHSIREFGLMQPIVVRPLPAEPAIGQLPAEPAIGPLPAEPAVGQLHAVSYELVMGERRWRAAQQAGLDTIPAIVRSTADDAMLRDALLENIHRVQLNPLEEAAAYQQLLEEFGATHEELARKIGRSRPQISNTIRLLNLPPQVQR
ncbi:MAG: ParB/RepB/Spo0J family partition protein, partial [Pseudonocardiaceae bacterium]